MKDYATIMQKMESGLIRKKWRIIEAKADPVQERAMRYESIT